MLLEKYTLYIENLEGRYLQDIIVSNFIVNIGEKYENN